MIDEILQDLSGAYVAGNLKRTRFIIEAKAQIEAHYISKEAVIKAIDNIVGNFNGNRLRTQIQQELGLDNEKS